MFQVLDYINHIIRFNYQPEDFEIGSKNNLYSDLLKMFSFSFKATNQTMENKPQWLVLNKNYGTGLILLVT